MPPPAYSETDPGYGQGQASAPAYGGGTEVMVVTGGWDGDRALETVEMFDPRTSQWSFLPNMMGECQYDIFLTTLTEVILVPRRDHGAGVLGEFLYVVGGWNTEPYYSSVERFHLASQTWSPGPGLSSARGWPGVAVLGDYLYCVGGYDGRDRAVSTVERLHKWGDRWERVADMNKVRGGCGLVAYQGRLYAIGGYDGRKKKKSVEMYDPAENRWRQTAEMPYPREDLSHSCTVFKNTIVVAGGLGEGDQVLSSCLVFNPNTEGWAPLQSNLVKEKRGISLAVVGGVLWGAGGEDRNDQNLEMMMIYDNGRQAWTQGPSMRTGRAGHGVAVIQI